MRPSIFHISGCRRYAFLMACALVFCSLPKLYAQKDTTIVIDNGVFTLPDVMVRNTPQLPALLRRIQNDTSFYKAFRSLRVIGYTADNHIRMLDKKGNIEASYTSRTKQLREGNCRLMEVLQQNTTGKMLNKKGQFNYTTGNMFAGLFFTNGRVCGENNIVKGHEFETDGKKGLEKHKEQLKMLFFNPGRKIPGIPFIGNKLDLYDQDARSKYNYHLDTVRFNNRIAYKFSITPKPGATGIVIRDMVTWFDYRTMEVLGRNYVLRYSAGVYDFDVNMKVLLEKVDGLLLPVKLYYKGNWGVLLKGHERGEFDATLSDFHTHGLKS